MAFAWYTPTLVQPFGSTKNTDINNNLNAIAAAFNAQNAQVSSSASLTIPSSGSRNILYDLSQAPPGSFYICSLPTSPTVGDPPVTVTCVAAAPQTSGSAVTGVVITTLDGSSINGVANTARHAGVPFLTFAGDTITLVFIGGAVGWNIVNNNIGAFTNAANTVSCPWAPTFLEVFQGSNALVDTTAAAWGAFVAAESVGLPLPGMSAAITALNTTRNIQFGVGSQTFNGVAGPYVISAANIRYLFTCTAANTFNVTT